MVCWSDYRSQPEGSLLCFNRISRSGLELDEGLAIGLLNLFSRYALVEACEELVKTHLRPILAGSPIREWHLSPLLAAYMSVGRLVDAIRVFEEIKNAVISPLSSVGVYAEPSYRLFLEGLKTAQQSLRASTMLEEILDDMPARIGQSKLPIQLVNAVLSACNRHSLPQDFRRLSLRIFKSAPASAGPKIDIDTFNILLANCLPIANAGGLSDLDRIYSDTSAAEALIKTLKSDFTHLSPNETTYETTIQVYLQAEGESWDLAYNYLEEMKHFNIKPSSNIYIAFLHRQLDEVQNLRDALDDSNEEQAKSILASQAKQDHRITILLQEMAVLGYLGGRSRNGFTRQVLDRVTRDRIGLNRIERIIEGSFSRGKRKI